MALNHVKSYAFKTYTKRLAGDDLKVHGRTFFTNKMESLFHDRRNKLIESLRKASQVGTTVDCWSSRHRKKFLGETVHWFKEDSLTRQSACLAIRRLTGSTTYIELGKEIESIHSEFNIGGKVAMMTTDNGSNFLKAARVFGEHNGAPVFDEENCDDQYEEVEFISIDSILSEMPQPTRLPPGVLPISLPPHSKCACHLFNLICTADVAKITNETFNTILKSVDSKINKLCKKQHYSDIASDYIRGELGGLFISKNDTRWNSDYNAKHRIYQYAIKKKTELTKVMNHFKVAPLQQIEIDFLSEYLLIMKEVVHVLELLQGEKQIGMGFLIPTLVVLEEQIESFKEHGNIKHCHPLLDQLKTSIHERYNIECLNISSSFSYF